MAKEEVKNKKVKRPTALKRDIQSEKRRLQNKSFRSQVRSAIRQLESSIPEADAQATKDRLNLVYSLMDKGVKKGVYKINKASRTKSRLTARVAALSKS